MILELDIWDGWIRRGSGSKKNLVGENFLEAFGISSS